MEFDLIPSVAGAASPAVATNVIYESFGFEAGAPGRALTSGANAKGAAVQIGTTVSEWNSLELYWNAAARSYLVDISIDGGATWPFSDIPFSNSGSTGYVAKVSYPFHIPAGSALAIRMQAASANTGKLYVVGTPRPALGFAGYDNALGQNLVKSGNTLFSTTQTPLSTGIAWTALGTTTRAIGALIMSFNSVATPVTQQGVAVAIAKGAPGSEIELRAGTIITTTSSGQVFGFNLLIQSAIASGVPISARVGGATASADNFYVGYAEVW